MSMGRKNTGRVLGTAFRSGEGCFFVRRPLLAVLVCLSAAIWFALLLSPVPLPDYEPYRGSMATVTGTVSWIEPKQEGDTSVWRVTLSRVSIEEDAGTANAPAVSVSASEEGTSAEGEQAVQTDTLSPGPRERVFCILDQEPRIEPGARVRVRGKVTPFQRAMNEGEFDVRMYYHILRISWSLRDAQILAAAKPAGHLDSLLFHIRRKLSQSIDRCFSQENAPIVKAVLTGEKGMLDEETKELYQGAGIIHILSISGLHLSLIGMGLFALSGRIRLLHREIPLPVRAFSALLFVCLYGKMTGMGTSSFRAFVMLSLYMTAGVIGRTYDLPTAAGIAAVLLLVDQPLYLLHTGFQFSFAAVFSMGILLPTLPGGLPGKALKVLAVPLGTLPVYLWAYGTFPVWSLLLNLLVIPLMPAVMCSAAAAVLLDLLFPAAGIPAGITALPAEWILTLYRFLAESAGKLPGSRIVPGRPGIPQTMLFYAMLLFLAAVSAHLQMPHVRRKLETPDIRRKLETPDVRRKLETPDVRRKLQMPDSRRKLQMPDSRRKLETPQRPDGPAPAEKRIDAVLAPALCLLQSMDNRQRRNAGALCAFFWMAAAVLVLVIRRPPAFEMDILYVGQGDGILIACEGRYFLIDGGSSSKSELAKYTLIPFLHCRGTGHLDGFILTHEDMDHCRGLLDLLESAAAGKPELTIGRIYLPEIAEACKGDNYRKIKELAAQAKVPVSYISRGMRLRTGSLTLDCLHPAAGASYENANEYSTTLLLRYHAFSALLTGDLEGQGEEDLMDYLRKASGNGPDPGRDLPDSENAHIRLDMEASEDAQFRRDINTWENLQTSGQMPEAEDDPAQAFPPVTLLKVAHHGSKYATGEDFLELAAPELAVISAGRNNLYGHPHPELLDRLVDTVSPACIYRTDLQGEISIRLRRKQSEIKSFLPDAARASLPAQNP